MDWYRMVWRKYAEFNGRSRRTEYWMFLLFNVLAILVLGAVAVAGVAMSNQRGSILFIPLGLYILAAIIPSLAVATRRFHDTGKSGWLLLLLIVLGMIPFAGIIASLIQIVFLCTDSEPGANQYGPNPKFPEQAAGLSYGGAGFSTMELSAPPLAGDSGHRLCKSCGSRMAVASSFCSKCGAHV